MNKDASPDAHDQPVAYDSEGRPLYAHPYQERQSVVHVARSMNPEAPEISPEQLRRHERSMRQYPGLNLSAGEYIIAVVHRHWIGLVTPLALGTILIGIILSIFFNYDVLVDGLGLSGIFSDAAVIAVPVFAFVILIGLSMFVATYVYTRNRFILTNESVIQEIQMSLFSRQEQTVSLANIEDASFTQRGIPQQIFDYGNIRLSTEGDETTYRFTYVASPKAHIARLNNAVEAFKNGRPVSDD